MNLETRQYRVLVVDDNTEAAELLQMLLDLHGYDVHIASSGEAGLVEADVFRPHVIVSDVKMPGMSGLQLAATLRQSADFSRTLLIAVSGYTGDTFASTVHDAGFDAYFAKPVSYVDLSARLDSYFIQCQPWGTRNQSP